MENEAPLLIFRVKIINAEDLLKRRKTFAQIASKQEGITIIDKYKTNIIKNSNNPIYNFQCLIEVNVKKVKNLLFKVYRYHSVIKNSLIGEGILNLKECIEKESYGDIVLQLKYKHHGNLIPKGKLNIAIEQVISTDEIKAHSTNKNEQQIDNDLEHSDDIGEDEPSNEDNSSNND